MDDDDGYESFKTALPNMDEIDSMPSSPGALTPAGQPFTPVRLSYAERAVLASRLDGPQANALLQEVRECHGVPRVAMKCHRVPRIATECH
jgi:hypothetical protein